MPFSSSKKTKIEIDDNEIVEENIKEASKLGSDDYDDFVEEEIRIEDELPEHSSKVKGLILGQIVSPAFPGSAGMSHFTETYMEDISLPDFQNGRSDIPADRHEGQDDGKVFYTPKPYPRLHLSFIG